MQAPRSTSRAAVADGAGGVGTDAVAALQVLAPGGAIEVVGVREEDDGQGAGEKGGGTRLHRRVDVGDVRPLPFEDGPQRPRSLIPGTQRLAGQPGDMVLGAALDVEQIDPRPSVGHDARVTAPLECGGEVVGVVLGASSPPVHADDLEDSHLARSRIRAPESWSLSGEETVRAITSKTLPYPIRLCARASNVATG